MRISPCCQLAEGLHQHLLCLLQGQFQKVLTLASRNTHNEELDAVEGEEFGGDEEEPPLGVLADDLEKEVEKPEDPHPAEDDGGAKDGVRVGTDVDRLGPHLERRAHNLSLRWLNWE